MWLSKINQMSVGPLWVLRDQPDAVAGTNAGAQAAQPNCPVCGQPWLEYAPEPGQEISAAPLIVLPEPLTDQAQQLLLQNCLLATGIAGVIETAACLSLHSGCTANPESALAALQAQIEHTSPQAVIVFGAAAAEVINPAFRPGQLHQHANTALIVTCHPQEMLANPMLKAQVWSDLCLFLATHAA